MVLQHMWPDHAQLMAGCTGSVARHEAVQDANWYALLASTAAFDGAVGPTIQLTDFS